MSGGAWDWVRDSVKEIGSHVSGMFRDDNTGGGNAGQTQGTGSSSSHSGGGSNSSSSHSGGASSYGQSAWSEPFKFDPNTHSLEDLKDLGCKGKAGIYLIRDGQDEHSLYVGKAEATSRDILSRLEAHLITGEGNAGIRERIEQGETLTIRWVECDRSNAPVYESVAMAYLLPTDNERCEYLGAERYIHIYEEMEIAVSLDLPSFWHANYADMVEEAKEEDLYVAGYGSNRIETAEAIFRKCNEEIKDDSTSGYESGHSSDRGNTNYQDSVGSLLGGLIGSLFSPIVDLFDSGGSESSKPDGVDSSSEPESDSNSRDSDGSWFGGWFGTSSESGVSEYSEPNEVDSSSSQESDHSSDPGNSNSGESGGSWFGGWFGGSSDGESDGYGSSDSGDSGGYDSGSSDSYDSGSSDSGYSGGYDSGSSDSYDSGSSDSGDSGGYDSGSSDSYDSGSSDSGDSGGYDSGSSDSYDSGSSDSGDSGDSDSGSSSDSWW